MSSSPSIRSYTLFQNRADRSGDVVQSSTSRAASEKRWNTARDASVTASGERPWPSAATTVLNSSGNDGAGWTSVSPTSNRTARRGIAGMLPAGGRSCGEVVPEHGDLVRELLSRSLVVEEDV